MSKVPAELRYTKSHEWVRKEADGTVTIGITDHAQEALGDLVFVEAPEAGRTVEQGEAVAVVESVKAASDVYASIGGEVVAGNDALADTPELVNTDPYGQGWIMKIRPSNAAAVDALLDAAGYSKVLDEA
ncbi:MAG TPA: glycine cleavage system protein GcvH [Gammaproteobacteria bacterium]